MINLDIIQSSLSGIVSDSVKQDEDEAGGGRRGYAESQTDREMGRPCLSGKGLISTRYEW